VELVLTEVKAVQALLLLSVAAMVKTTPMAVLPVKLVYRLSMLEIAIPLDLVLLVNALLILIVVANNIALELVLAIVLLLVLNVLTKRQLANALQILIKFAVVMV